MFPEWDASQEYIAGKSVVTYQTNLYISVLDSTNVLPTVQDSWKKLNPSTSSSGVVTIAGGGTGASTAADARTNLGIGTSATADFPVANGLVVKLSDNTLVARAIAGTTGYITVTNGDGVSGNLTINVGANVAKTDADASWTTTSSIRLPAGSTAQRGVGAPGRIRFNLESGVYEGYDNTGWNPIGSTGTLDVQNFSGDGVKTSFTMSTTPRAENNTQVYFNGVYQQKNSYNLVGSNLVFDEAPALGIEIEVVTVSSVAIGTTTAGQTSIVDSGNYFSSGSVEGALQEVGLKASFVKDAILSYPDFAAASAVAATLPDGQQVKVSSDPAYRGVPTLNVVSAGSLQFVALADPMKLLFGEKTNGVYYRYGTIYESKGAVEKAETRAFLHDFRPTVADGSAFNTDGANMFMGFGSGNFTMKAVADADLPAGRDPNLQCSHNTGYGVQALSKVTVGYKNLALGNNAGRQLTDGFGNVFVGQEASREGTNQTNSVVIGFSAGFYANASYDTIVGAAALYYNTSGNGNTAIGRRAGFDQTSGAYNVFLGEQAGFGFTSGDYNTFIGKQATTTGYTTGNSSVVIGSRISGLQDETGQVVIADGAGAKHLEIHKDASATLKKPSYLELPSREVTFQCQRN